MSIDLTGLATAVIAGVFSILGVVIPMMIQYRMKDKQAAAVLSNAVTNALGAIQQAAITGKKPPVIADVSRNVAVGVQYVADHAREELKRFPAITPALIADKIEAKQGLQSLAASAAVPTIPHVLYRS